MRNIERLQHELHAKLPAFKRKVDKARAIIDNALTAMHRPYIAFSTGVDSTVLLEMLYSSDCRIPVLFGDDGVDYPQSLQFLDNTELRCAVEIQRIRCLEPWRDWCIEMARPDLAVHGPTMDDAWLNPHQWHATWSSLKDSVHHGYSGVFLGLLASEARGRSYVLKGGYKPLYQVKEENGMWHCSPLASWTKQDIWAYVVSRGIPYNPIYDRLAEIGVPLERRRVAPLTCFRVMQYGSITQFRQIDPSLYNKLSATFPKIREYS
jgi:phosphoadenosine phosphosulfate reductase